MYQSSLCKAEPSLQMCTKADRLCMELLTVISCMAEAGTLCCMYQHQPSRLHVQHVHIR